MEIAAIASFLVLVILWLVIPLRVASPAAGREVEIVSEVIPATSVAA